MQPPLAEYSDVVDVSRSAFSILVPCANLLCVVLLCGEYRQKTGAKVGPYEVRTSENL